MRPEYDGVKYYSKNDMSIGWQLEKAEPIIIGYSEDKEIKSINVIIELYNIQELMEVGVTLNKWSDDTLNTLKTKTQTFMRKIASFFLQICDENFIKYSQEVAIGYMDDFWALFTKFKVYQRISPENFLEYLKLEDTALYKILEHKELVKTYDAQLTEALRSSNQTCKILVTQFLEKTKVKYFLPKSFKPDEFERIFQEYIDSDYVNPNVLKLIYDAQSTGECPISDRLRLNAKHKYSDYWEKTENKNISIGYGVGISFLEQDELKKCTQEGNNYHLTYDINWLEENLDFPTILNNFFYIFEMFDICWRSTLVSVKSQMSQLERVFSTRGIKFYQRGNHFRIASMISSAQMEMYYEFLKAHNVDLENVFVWFFTEYLKKEFGVEDFFMKASSSTDYVEKCRTLSSEMDGILKQYRMIVNYGSIDRELFEISSEHMLVENVPSLIKEKYAYACSDDIIQEMFMMFSDQSMLSYIEQTKSEYPTLFELLKNKKVKIEDFEKYQVTSINWLIEQKTLIIDEKGSVILNTARVGLLKDLYDHDVICINYCGKWKSELYRMVNSGDIRVEGKLFSIPEMNFLNYELNKSEYSDGLDLKNKYSHSTYPQDEKIQKRDYIELLKIMVVIVTKINEEYCLREKMREE